MSKEDEVVEKPAEEEGFVKPDPSKSPRNIILGEIAATVAKQHTEDFKETFESVDEEGKVVEVEAPESPLAEEVITVDPALAAATSAPAVEPVVEPSGIDPEKLYKVKVDGQEIEVSGQKIIDAGFRTFQKETAADFRLNVATELMQEAERRLASSKAPEGKALPTPASEPETSDADLAKAVQFGTPEQAEAAVKSLRGRGFDPNQISNIVAQQSRNAARDELAFQSALTFVKDEYGDLLANDYLKRLFFVEENRYRAPKERGGLGDVRPYTEVYKEIGENLRKSLNLPKPTAAPSTTEPSTSTASGRRAVKAATPPPPRTAASRLQESSGTAKAKTASEIIATMAEKRGQGRLTPLTKE